MKEMLLDCKSCILKLLRQKGALHFVHSLLDNQDMLKCRLITISNNAVAKRLMKTANLADVPFL